MKKIATIKQDAPNFLSKWGISKIDVLVKTETKPDGTEYRLSLPFYDKKFHPEYLKDKTTQSKNLLQSYSNVFYSEMSNGQWVVLGKIEWHYEAFGTKPNENETSGALIYTFDSFKTLKKYFSEWKLPTNWEVKNA